MTIDLSCVPDGFEVPASGPAILPCPPKNARLESREGLPRPVDDRGVPGIVLLRGGLTVSRLHLPAGSMMVLTLIDDGRHAHILHAPAPRNGRFAVLSLV
jgi:hypothetical protein